MSQDIREALKNHKEQPLDLSTEHAAKFQLLLDKKLHAKKVSKPILQWVSIAASIILLLGVALHFYTGTTSVKLKFDSKEISLGSISPEFETIEQYYSSSIRLEISQLQLTDSNKEIVDEYLLKIVELTKEYKLLTIELNKNGVNDATIEALIRNLQLRLQLLKRLRNQLNQLKNLNKIENEKQVI